jgi:hypothetical protein
MMDDDFDYLHYNSINPAVKFEIKRHPHTQQIDNDILKLLVKIIGVKEIQLKRSNFIFDHFEIRVDFGKGKFSVEIFLNNVNAVYSVREELNKLNIELFKLRFHNVLEIGVNYQ